jgi:hypothetical protein
MHYHPVPDEGWSPAYCPDHTPQDVPVYECWSKRSWHSCVTCMRERPDLPEPLRSLVRPRTSNSSKPSETPETIRRPWWAFWRA